MVQNYSALKEVAGTKPGRQLETLLRMADLDRALALLPLDLWKVMLVHGLIGVPQAETAAELHLSQRAISKRFHRGIEELYFHMNQEELSEQA